MWLICIKKQWLGINDTLDIYYRLLHALFTFPCDHSSGAPWNRMTSNMFFRDAYFTGCPVVQCVLLPDICCVVAMETRVKRKSRRAFIRRFIRAGAYPKADYE